MTRPAPGLHTSTATTQQTSLCSVSYILANGRTALAFNRFQCANAQGLKDCGRQDNQNAQCDDSKLDRMVMYEPS